MSADSIWDERHAVVEELPPIIFYNGDVRDAVAAFERVQARNRFAPIYYQEKEQRERNYICSKVAEMFANRFRKKAMEKN